MAADRSASIEGPSPRIIIDPAKMSGFFALRSSESTLAASSSSMTRAGDDSVLSDTSASSGDSTSPSTVLKGRAMWTGPGRPDVAMSSALRMSLGRPEGLSAVHEGLRDVTCDLRLRHRLKRALVVLAHRSASTQQHKGRLGNRCYVESGEGIGRTPDPP